MTTPQRMFDDLNKEFSFTVDACASHGNAKCDRYWTAETDALRQSWSGETVFCNPPYQPRGSQGNFVRKACNERDCLSVLILQSNTSTNVFHDYLWDQYTHQPRPGVQLRFVHRTVKFDGYEGRAIWPTVIAVIDRRSKGTKRKKQKTE